MPRESLVQLKNPNLSELNSDHLYHLGINISNTNDLRDIIEKFGDVKFVCMGGTKSRMEALALHLRKELFSAQQTQEPLEDLCEHAHRYAVYKVGPVLCCSHGIGMASMSILLHEVMKLVKYAKCVDPVLIRIGSCGGLGLEPGTVVITKDAYNGYLRNEHEIAILGQRVVRPAKFNEGVIEELLKSSYPSDNFETVMGNTMAADCFYEGQGRLDGAVCNYTSEDKMNFLKKMHDKYDIRNIEMEATMFSSLTLHAGLRAADVCVTFVNRLQGDQIMITCTQKKDFETRPLIIVARYIKRMLSI